VDGQKFREYFIEGIDYLNDEVDWSNAGDEATPVRSAAAVTSNQADAGYRSFGQLNAAQKQAVLNHLQYKAAYQFEYSDAKLHKTLNGTTTVDSWTPDWAQNEELYYHVDVAGWRDKYIRMPSGSQADVLRVVSQGVA